MIFTKHNNNLATKRLIIIHHSVAYLFDTGKYSLIHHWSFIPNDDRCFLYKLALWINRFDRRLEHFIFIIDRDIKVYEVLDSCMMI